MRLDTRRLAELACGLFCALATMAAPAAAQTPFNHRGIDTLHPGSSVLPNEQVDPASGALSIVATDLVLRGNAGLDLSVTRVYNSNVYPNYSGGNTTIEEDSWAGIGWKLHFGRIINPDSTVGGETQIEMGDGSRHPLYHEANGGWITTDFWLYDRTTHTLKLPNGIVYVFDRVVTINATIGTVRYVTEIRDPFNNRLTFSYFPASGPSDGIQQIQQHLGAGQIRTVTFTYDATLKALATMTYNGRTWTYTQQPAGPAGFSTVTAVQPPIGPGWQYQYTALTGELTRLTTPSGGYLTYAYADAQRRAGPVTTTTRVVAARSTGGPSIVAGTWTYAYGTGSNQDTTVVSCPCGTTKYRFYGTGISGNFAAWSAGTLVDQRIEENDGTLREVRAMTWAPSEVISPDPVPSAGGVWGDTTVRKALLTQVAVTRGPQTWTTTLSYRSGLGNYNDYGRPYQTQEVEAVYRWRTTTRTFQYGFTPYIMDRVGTESIQIMTAYGQTVGPANSNWTYNPADGFLTGQALAGATTTFEPSAEGNIAASTDGRGNRTTYAYTWGAVQDVHTPSTQTTYTITSDGVATSVDNHVDSTTNYVYDAGLRPTQVQRAGVNPVIYEYDNVNGRFVRVARDQAQTESQVDGFGRTILTSNHVNLKTRVELDACGRMTFTSAPYTSGGGTRGTTMLYDALGRTTRTTNPVGDVTQTTYTGVDFTRIDGENRGTTFHYVAYSGPGTERLLSVTDATSTTTSYEYDVFGNLTKVAGPQAGVTRTWIRDARGVALSDTQPESGTTSYLYDAVGQITSRTTSNNQVTTFTYDTNNRLKTINAPGTADDVTLTYDGAGRLANQVGGGVNTTFGFDIKGRQTSRSDVINGLTFTSSYTYDANDNLSTLTYPSGRVITYLYDVENRLTTIKNNGVNFAQNFAYGDNGQLASYVTGSVTHTFTPDQADRLARILSASPSGTLDLAYTYDHVGNVKTIADPRAGMSQTFDYDALYRLYAADGPWGQLRLGYDAAGNRMTETRGSTTTYAYDAATQRLSSTSGAVTESFGYDTLGRVITDGRGTYTYNARDLLATFTRTGVSATYAYDVSGLRIAQTVNGQTTYTIRAAGGTLLSEYRAPCGTAVWARDVVYAGGRAIGGIRSNAPLPSIQLTAASATVSESQTSLSIGVKLTTPGGGATTCAVTVAYDTTPGTATPGADYAKTSGTLTFAAGTPSNTTQNVMVSLLSDTTNEPNETLTFLLASTTGATIGAPAAELVTILDDDAAPVMAIEQPGAGATVKTPFAVLGWAIDSTVATGTGVDAIHVYATPTGGSASLLGVATYGQARGDVGALYGSRFSNSGYVFTASLTPGTYMVAVYARNSATGVFNNARTVYVTVAPSIPQMSLDWPSAGSVMAQPFVLGGWAVDQNAGSGTGVSQVDIAAYPSGGGNPIQLGSATYGLARGDVGQLYGAAFTNSGFEMAIRGLAAGTYQFVASARSTVTTTFNQYRAVTMTVAANPRMAVDVPTPNGSVNQTFTVSGWAIDLAAAVGTGVNTIHVWAYPSAGGSAIFLGVPSYGSARGDVGAIFGTQFTNSGYTLTATLPPGAYQLAVYPFSMIANSFTQAQTLTATVATSQPLIAVDAPTNNSTTPMPFVVSGWAIDRGAPSGTGVDAVHVYASANGGAGSQVMLGAATYGGSRGDVGAAYGPQFTSSGYSISVSGLAPGYYRLNVYAHSTVSNIWTMQALYVTVP